MLISLLRNNTIKGSLDKMKKDEDKLLVRIAEMYYQENKTQSQIATELNIHRSTISRLLKRSKEEGIVQVTIKYDTAGTYSLEQELEKRYGLDRAIIVRVGQEVETKKKEQLMGKAVSDYISQIVQDSMKIGFSWGRSLAAMVEKLDYQSTNDIICVPMIGGPAGALSSEYHVNTITYQAAKKLNGNALMIDSPAITGSPDIKNSLLNTPYNIKLTNLWKELDMAIFGIGSPLIARKEVWRAFYGESIIAELKENNVVGDILSSFFDIRGKHVKLELHDRRIGIDFDTLKKIKVRIGVAESKDKSLAILGALRGNLLTSLITTEETARDILFLDKS